MRDVQFMALTGHLDNYPLPSLIKTLYGQRKSGRLQIEYAESPGSLYFEQGKLVDARLGDLRGLEALLLALSLPGAAFNFNPLIKPPDRSFPDREQNFIRELLEASSGPALETAAISPADAGHLQIVYDDDSPAMAAQPAQLTSSLGEERVVSEVRALLTAHSRRFSRERAVYAGIIAVLVMMAVGSRFIGSSTSEQPTTRTSVAQLATDAASNDVVEPPKPAPLVKPADVAPASLPAQPLAAPVSRQRTGRRVRVPRPHAGTNTDEVARKPASSPAEQTVSILMQVDGGRVVQAKVQNSRPGMAAYEALALRMARQRRYPDGFSGQDTLQVKVKP